MSESDDQSNAPKSIRQRRILDLAAEEPGASYDDIAERVPSASADLVERVLEEYGDPAPPAPTPAGSNGTDTEPTPAGDEAPAGDGTVDADALSETELETLRAIYEHPSATQQEIADRLDVSRATVSNRIRDIDGFEWADRESLTADLFADPPSAVESGPAADSDDSNPKDSPGDESHETADAAGDDTAERTATEAGSDAGADAGSGETDSSRDEENALSVDGTGSATGTETEPTSDADIEDEVPAELAEAVSELSERVAAVERRLEAIDAGGAARDEAIEVDESDTDATGGASSPFDDTEFAHRVVKACLDADEVTEDDERRLVQVLIAR